MMEKIAVGSEAVVMSKGNLIIKYRVKKGYRIKALDDKLRKSRTRREFKIIQKCYENGINVPMPIKMSKDQEKIYMQKIDGISFDNAFSTSYLMKLGEMVADMHKLGIIHGDLTTANIILSKDKLYLIDFGLSYFSNKSEDRATDIFLFKNAIKSMHTNVYKEAYNIFIKGYKKRIGKEFKDVEEHLKDIEKRRRYHENS